MAYYDGYEDDGGVGYRFKPTDEELVGYFLYKKVVARQPLPPMYYDTVLHFDKPVSYIIPWEFWEKFGGPCLLDDGCVYFFSDLETTSSTRKGKGKASSRIKRKIESTGGTWSESNSWDVTDRNENPIGRKRYFRYEKLGYEHHGDWLLDEYSLLNVASKTVLCRLRKNPSSQEFKDKPKGANKKARKDWGSSSVRPQIPSVISADYEQPPPPPQSYYSTTVTSDQRVHDQALMMSNTKTERVHDEALMGTETERVHDQALMISNTDYDPAGEGDHGNGLMAYDPIWFGAGGTNIEEEYWVDIDEMLAPIEELPTYYELGAENSIINLELPPKDDSVFWSSSLKMSEGTDQFYY